MAVLQDTAPPGETSSGPSQGHSTCTHPGQNNNQLLHDSCGQHRFPCYFYLSRNIWYFNVTLPKIGFHSSAMFFYNSALNRPILESKKTCSAIFIVKEKSATCIVYVAGEFLWGLLIFIDF